MGAFPMPVSHRTGPRFHFRRRRRRACSRGVKKLRWKPPKSNFDWVSAYGSYCLSETVKQTAARFAPSLSAIYAITSCVVTSAWRVLLLLFFYVSSRLDSAVIRPACMRGNAPYVPRVRRGFFAVNNTATVWTSHIWTYQRCSHTRAHVRFFRVTIRFGGLLYLSRWKGPWPLQFPHAKLITFPFSMF